MSLGENIRALRKERGVSQEELATAIGMKHPRISELERNLGNPTLATLTKIADFFGVSEAFLLSPRKFSKIA